MKRVLDQTLIGLWSAMGVWLGIVSKSWTTFVSFMVVAVFLACGSWAARSLKSENILVRRLGITVAVMYALFFVFMIVMTIERVYLVNGTSYPSWLATKDLGTYKEDHAGNFGQIRNISKEYCQGFAAEVYGKDDGLIVMRCGDIAWYDSQTYIARFKDAK